MFCRARAGSKEDAWPKWLLRKLAAPSGVRVDAERGRAKLPPWRQADAGVLVKHVCAPCNNGWMSRLESLAKPTVEMLLDEPACALDVAAQSGLAAWATKSAMVFEAVRLPEKEWFYSAEDRAAMKRSHDIPSRTNVWLGPILDLNGFFAAASDMSEAPPAVAHQVRGYVTTMAFGSVALQVATLRGPHVPANVALTTSVRKGPWDSCTLRIWPSTEPVSWPPTQALNGEAGFEALRSRFAP
jgi:hypothetical protein